VELRSIAIQNYKALQDVRLKGVPKFMVLVGANGTGKTTFFDVFGFLRDALTGNIRQALDSRGRFPEVVTRGHEDEPIVVELQIQMDIADRSRLVTYGLEIASEASKPFVKREFLRYKRGPHGAPYYFLDFKRGQGFAITNEEDYNKKDEDLEREEQKLESPDILAIKGLGQFRNLRRPALFGLC